VLVRLDDHFMKWRDGCLACGKNHNGFIPDFATASANGPDCQGSPLAYLIFRNI
jgi:hypothetical protein